jgi:hypothetical protein
MPSYVRLGCNAILVLRVKASLELHRLIDRIFPRGIRQA